MLLIFLKIIYILCILALAFFKRTYSKFNYSKITVYSVVNDSYDVRIQLISNSYQFLWVNEHNGHAYYTVHDNRIYMVVNDTGRVEVIAGSGVKGNYIFGRM